MSDHMPEITPPDTSAVPPQAGNIEGMGDPALSDNAGEATPSEGGVPQDGDAVPDALGSDAGEGEGKAEAINLMGGFGVHETDEERQVIAELAEQVKEVGGLRQRFDEVKRQRSVSVATPPDSPTRGAYFVSRHDSQGRRRSLATLAYEQARANASFLRHVHDGMEDIAKDNEELTSFLDRRRSWKEHCGHNIANFARSINNVRSTKKAAHQFLSLIGRELSGTGGASQSSRPEGFPYLANSSILEHAQKQKVTSSKERRDFGTHATTQLALPGGRPPPVGKGSKAARDQLIRRFRPGTSENEAMCLQETQARKGETVGSVLPGQSLHSSAMKYSVSPVTSQPQPRSDVVTMKHATYLPRERDMLTIVTGSVDYAQLLEDQRHNAKQLEAHDREYIDLIDTYDKIQNRIQRKFSALLKVTTDGSILGSQAV